MRWMLLRITCMYVCVCARFDGGGVRREARGRPFLRQLHARKGSIWHTHPVPVPVRVLQAGHRHGVLVLGGGAFACVCDR